MTRLKLHEVKDDMRFEDIKKRLFRLESLVWIIFGINLYEGSKAILPMVSAFVGG